MYSAEEVTLNYCKSLSTTFDLLWLLVLYESLPGDSIDFIFRPTFSAPSSNSLPILKPKFPFISWWSPSQVFLHARMSFENAKRSGVHWVSSLSYLSCWTLLLSCAMFRPRFPPQGEQCCSTVWLYPTTPDTEPLPTNTCSDRTESESLWNIDSGWNIASFDFVTKSVREC